MSKLNNCVFTRPAALLRIERLKKLLVVPLSKIDVADKLAMHTRTAYSYLTYLHQEKVVYIATWDRTQRGRLCRASLCA